VRKEPPLVEPRRWPAARGIVRRRPKYEVVIPQAVNRARAARPPLTQEERPAPLDSAPTTHIATI